MCLLCAIVNKIRVYRILKSLHSVYVSILHNCFFGFGGCVFGKWLPQKSRPVIWAPVRVRADKRKADVFGYFVLSCLGIMVWWSTRSTRGQIGAKLVKGRWQRANKSSEKRRRELRGEGRGGEPGDLGETMNGENSLKCKRNLCVCVCWSVCLGSMCLYGDGGGVSLKSGVRVCLTDTSCWGQHFYFFNTLGVWGICLTFVNTWFCFMLRNRKLNISVKDDNSTKQICSLQQIRRLKVIKIK